MPETAALVAATVHFKQLHLQGEQPPAFVLVTWKCSKSFDIQLTNGNECWAAEAVTPPQDHVLDDDSWLAMCQAAFCQLSPSQDFQFSISQRPNVTGVSLSFAWTHEGVADGEVEKLSIRVPLLPVPDNGEAMRGILSRICYDYCQLLGSVQGLQASCSAQAALLQDRDREVEQLTTSSKARDRELFTKFTVLHNNQVAKLQELEQQRVALQDEVQRLQAQVHSARTHAPTCQTCVGATVVHRAEVSGDAAVQAKGGGTS
ncbi:hypothetical protein V8C86DRAFT_2600311 [Haematococcus lacustris]